MTTLQHCECKDRSKHTCLSQTQAIHRNPSLLQALTRQYHIYPANGWEEAGHSVSTIREHRKSIPMSCMQRAKNKAMPMSKHAWMSKDIHSHALPETSAQYAYEQGLDTCILPHVTHCSICPKFVHFINPNSSNSCTLRTPIHPM